MARSRPIAILPIVALAASALQSMLAAPALAQLQPRTDRAALTAPLQRVLENHMAARVGVERMTALSVSVSFAGDEPNLNVAVGRVSRALDAAPVTPAHLFQIGSITKSMTAAVILQLTTEGRLSLDDPLGRWLPEYPAWRDVPIRRLLNMTSGIPSYDKFPSLFASIARWGIDRRFSDAVLVSFVDPERPGAPPPTTGYDYSNTNYILAGMIVERATGKSFADELTRRILRAGYGLDNTFYSADVYPEPVLERMVSGYLAADLDDLVAKEHDAPAGTDSLTRGDLAKLIGIDFRRGGMSWGQAAGGAVATPEDVTRWARALFQGRVLRAAERATMTTVVSMKSGQSIATVSAEDAQGFGLGIMQVRFPNGHVGWIYEGGTLGYRMLYFYWPDDDLVIAVGANSAPNDTQDSLSALMKVLYETVTSRSLGARN